MTTYMQDLNYAKAKDIAATLTCGWHDSLPDCLPVKEDGRTVEARDVMRGRQWRVMLADNLQAAADEQKDRALATIAHNVRQTSTRDAIRNHASMVLARFRKQLAVESSAYVGYLEIHPHFDVGSLSCTFNAAWEQEQFEIVLGMLPREMRLELQPQHSDDYGHRVWSWSIELD